MEINPPAPELPTANRLAPLGRLNVESAIMMLPAVGPETLRVVGEMFPCRGFSFSPPPMPPGPLTAADTPEVPERLMLPKTEDMEMFPPAVAPLASIALAPLNAQHCRA